MSLMTDATRFSLNTSSSANIFEMSKLLRKIIKKWKSLDNFSKILKICKIRERLQTY